MAYLEDNDNLIYRLFVLEPRYTDTVFPISYTHRFGKALPFLSIERGDVLGKIICYFI